ncbi:hypothetical protein BCR34DRAFT_224687 [Clohesyomyces aquaticus]|uniref:Secreted protein n=1 Tax=Clohesyomyces aquaticus TaxID=1231657 RepID=A0A1Y1ZWT4_9PLEO|nr:hypothetical protein BCR34DRAFT_224687 [Clohesyomyces aquaticus]
MAEWNSAMVFGFLFSSILRILRCAASRHTKAAEAWAGTRFSSELDQVHGLYMQGSPRTYVVHPQFPPMTADFIPSSAPSGAIRGTAYQHVTRQSCRPLELPWHVFKSFPAEGSSSLFLTFSSRSCSPESCSKFALPVTLGRYLLAHH